MASRFAARQRLKLFIDRYAVRFPRFAPEKPVAFVNRIPIPASFICVSSVFNP
jgi:hypothetical protein